VGQIWRHGLEWCNCASERHFICICSKKDYTDTKFIMIAYVRVKIVSESESRYTFGVPAVLPRVGSGSNVACNLIIVLYKLVM
jgi:hypothetical protein